MPIYRLTRKQGLGMQREVIIRQARGQIKFKIKVSDYVANSLDGVVITYFDAPPDPFLRAEYSYGEEWVSAPFDLDYGIRSALFEIADRVVKDRICQFTS